MRGQPHIQPAVGNESNAFCRIKTSTIAVFAEAMRLAEHRVALEGSR